MRERFAANHAEHKAHVLQVVGVDFALLIVGSLAYSFPGGVTFPLPQFLHKHVLLIYTQNKYPVLNLC
jgi:hypothetical protein